MTRYNFLATALVAATLTFGASLPLVERADLTVPHQLLKRADNSSGLTDADILNYALTLEHLENAFYQAGVKNFSSSFDSASSLGNLAANVAQIGSDESNHVQLLTGALSAAGATPVQACTYKFPVSDASGFLAVAQILEGVGVSAYIGAARYIENPDYLTVAAEILTVEARHNAYIRLANGYSSFPSPYDTALTPKAVVSLAGSFFESCPDGSAPSIQPFPAATVANAANATIGSNIQVSFANSTSTNGTLYCAFASNVQAAFSTYSNGACEIPSQNVTGGQVYGFITTAQNISDASAVAGPFILNLDTKNATGSSMSNNAVKAVESSGAVKVGLSGLALGFVSIISFLFA